MALEATRERVDGLVNFYNLQVADVLGHDSFKILPGGDFNPGREVYGHFWKVHMYPYEERPIIKDLAKVVHKGLDSDERYMLVDNCLSAIFPDAEELIVLADSLYVPSLPTIDRIKMGYRTIASIGVNKREARMSIYPGIDGQDAVEELWSVRDIYPYDHKIEKQSERVNTLLNDLDICLWKGGPDPKMPWEEVLWLEGEYRDVLGEVLENNFVLDLVNFPGKRHNGKIVVEDRIDIIWVQQDA